MLHVEVLKLNYIFQLLVYADNVNVLSGRIHTLQENREALVIISKKIGLQANAEKPKCMVMSGDQNAGQNSNMIATNSYETVEHFKYLETTLTNKGFHSRRN
jgi:hypothetical protein